MAFSSPNGVLSYFNESLLVHPIWVDEVSQPLNLSIQKHSSRKAAYVYPRSYAPGDYTISGICDSQKSYQELSLFIRTHQ